MILDKVLTRVDSLKEFMAVAVREFIEENETFMISLNWKQLDKGKRADGQIIAPPYAKSTVQRKKRKGQQIKPPNLKDTGEHRKSMFIDTRDEEFEVIADYGLVGTILEKKYGKEILGVGEGSMEEFNKKFIPWVENKIKELILS